MTRADAERLQKLMADMPFDNCDDLEAVLENERLAEEYLAGLDQGAPAE